MIIATVKEFVKEWNKTHKKVFFTSYKASGSERPVSVEVRFPELPQSGVDLMNWNLVNALVEDESDGTMVITTNACSFEKGIIQLLISSRHTHFDERRIVYTLEKLGELMEG